MVKGESCDASADDLFALALVAWPAIKNPASNLTLRVGKTVFYMVRLPEILLLVAFAGTMLSALPT